MAQDRRGCRVIPPPAGRTEDGGAEKSTMIGKEDTMKAREHCMRFTKVHYGGALLALSLALAGPARGADPVLIGQWPGWPLGDAEGVAVEGSYAYVAAGTGGLYIFDVSDPADPQRVGGCATPGWAHRVAVSGNYAYVADDFGGCR